MSDKIISVEVQGSNLNCHFELRPTGVPNQVQHYSNVKIAHFAVNTGQEYTLLITIVGKDGTKYKVIVSNVKKIGNNEATFTLSGDKDALSATFIA